MTRRLTDAILMLYPRRPVQSGACRESRTRSPRHGKRTGPRTTCPDGSTTHARRPARPHSGVVCGHEPLADYGERAPDGWRCVHPWTADPRRDGHGAHHHDRGLSLPREQLLLMLIYSMSVSVDGFIADRDGGIGWTVPDDELFAFHLARVRELGCHLCGRRLYETMLAWETDPSLRDSELHAEFAEVWCALPKIVFSRSLDSLQGNARLAEGSVAEEIAAALTATDKDIEIGGAGLAASAIELDLVDELRMFRNPIVLGGGTPFLPPVTENVPLELVETKTFASRVVYERYRRARSGPE